MKPKILFLYPGPKYHVDSLFARRLNKLSEKYDGALVTISDEDVDRRYGSIAIKAKNEKYPKSWGATRRMFGLAYQELKEARKNHAQYSLLITYDPLKTGLMTLLLSLLFRVPYAVEVNGDYSSDANYIDIKSKFKRWVSKRKLLTVQNLVLTFSSGVKRLFKSHLEGQRCIRDKVVRTFPSYVDLSIFNERSSQNNKRVLFVGFPYYLKGVDILIEAFASVHSDYPDWELDVVGWFQDMEPINEAVKKHAFVNYGSPVYYEEMPKLMSGADILVLPSRTEAMGRVLLEAAKTGVARIGSTAGGIPEVIDDGVDGLIFESGNAVDLAEKLRILMGDEVKRKAMISEAEASLNVKFSEENYFRNSFGFIDSVLEVSKR